MSDLLSHRGRRLSAYAADDAHFRQNRLDHCAAWVQVRAENLTPEALLSSLKAGHFYSSQGPKIENIEITDGRIYIACSPAQSVFVSGRGAGAHYQHGNGITEYEFLLEQFAGSYCRVTVVDAAGKRAWSNPIWLD